MKSLRNFDFLSPTTLEEAVSILREKGRKAWPFAGGTDILSIMRFEPLPEDLYPEVLVNLKRIEPSLAYVDEDPYFVKIGALTRLADIARDQRIRKQFPALAEACRRVGSPHIREMGTIAGNICQITRCWYFRKENNRFHCLRKGGGIAWAMLGDNRYHSIFGAVKVETGEPCVRNCPNETEIAEILESVKKRRYEEAAEKLLKKNPLPMVTGRVCPRFCEEACSRKVYDAAVAIRDIERFLGDYILKCPDIFYRPSDVKKKQKIAIIGSGPAGLSAAYFLAVKGYRVIVYEQADEPGGMLRYGIPHFRLPKEIVSNVIDIFCKRLGVVFLTGVRIGDDVKLEELTKENDAVLVATGAWRERNLQVPGEEWAKGGLGFLKEFNEKGPSAKDLATYQKALVIGGGNVAIDVARSLKRLGSRDVTLVCLESEEEMPAFEEGLSLAREEGVSIFTRLEVLRIAKHRDGFQVICRKITSFQFDQDGNLKTVPTGHEVIFDTQVVVKAIGEVPDLNFIPQEWKDERGRLSFQDRDRQLLRGNVFVAGDLFTGQGSVVAAIHSGRVAAETIHRLLAREEVVSKQAFGLYPVGNSKLEKSMRINIAPVSVRERLANPFLEDLRTMSKEEVEEEVKRCINCGCVMAHPSDVAPALMVLGAYIITTKRTIPIDDFFRPDTFNSTLLEPDELIVEIKVPKSDDSVKSSFQKFSIRSAIDFPIVNCAVSLILSQGKVKDCKICLNAVAPIPYRAFDIENFLKGSVLEESAVDRAVDEIEKRAQPLLYNSYKVQIAKALIKRCLKDCIAPV